MAKELVNDTCIHLGLDYLNVRCLLQSIADLLALSLKKGKDEKILFLNCWFWCAADDPTYVSNLLEPSIAAQIRRLESIKGRLYFPIAERDANHWWVGAIDFEQRELYCVEGLGMPSPKNFRKKLCGLVNRLCGIDFKGFKPVRNYRCSYQQDSNSCGVVLLSYLQGLIIEDGLEKDRWTQDESDHYRLLWIERILHRHNKNLEFSAETSPVWRHKVNRGNRILISSSALINILLQPNCMHMVGREIPV